MTQRSVMSVYEGSDVQLTCILSRNYPVTEITWYNNLKQHVNEIPKKYVLERAAAWTNLTVRETDSETDSGQYWCSATNAVGGAEIPIMLMVKSKQAFKYCTDIILDIQYLQYTGTLHMHMDGYYCIYLN